MQIKISFLSFRDNLPMNMVNLHNFVHLTFLRNNIDNNFCDEYDKLTKYFFHLTYFDKFFAK